MKTSDAERRDWMNLSESRVASLESGLRGAVRQPTIPGTSRADATSLQRAVQFSTGAIALGSLSEIPTDNVRAVLGSSKIVRVWAWLGSEFEGRPAGQVSKDSCQAGSDV